MTRVFAPARERCVRQQEYTRASMASLVGYANAMAERAHYAGV
jgi:hypothetical protein